MSSDLTRQSSSESLNRAGSRRSEYKSGLGTGLSGSVSRLSVAVTPLNRQKSAMPGSSQLLLSKTNAPPEYPKLDLVDTTVPEDLRNRFQALVAEARQWKTSTDKLESSLMGVERRLAVLEVRHRVVA